MGQFDATNAWDSNVAVLTAVHLDHTDVLGNTLCEIAADKVHIARSGRPLFTGVGAGSRGFEVVGKGVRASGCGVACG